MSEMRYFKATRPDGIDFRTGTVDYGAAHSITVSTYSSPAQASATLWHELTHAAQKERFGDDHVANVEFGASYRRENATKGYRNNKFEVEARETADANPQEDTMECEVCGKAAPEEPTTEQTEGEARARRMGHPWLDGGYDRDVVEGCRYHPDHAWIVQRVGDMTDNCRDPEELLTVCKGCLAVRCGYTLETNPCILPRHHPERHLYLDGSQEADDVWPGSKKPPPPDIRPATKGVHHDD